mgnify:CR=1 FL=1
MNSMNPILIATLTIDVIGVLVGIVAIFVILSARQQIGGDVGKGLTIFIWGILSMILAFIYTIVFTRLKLVAAPPVDIHHALMTVGMLLFIVSAMRFFKTARF